MNVTVAYPGFQLCPPGSRKNNKFWMMRASLGRQVEISTKCIDQVQAADMARGFIDAFYAQEAKQAEQEIINSKCLVYFIADGVGRVKIGSSDDPLRRLKELQTGSARALSLYGVMPGDSKLERGLQAFFSPFRRQGEWFVLAPKLDRFISQRCQLSPSQILGKRKSPGRK